MANDAETIESLTEQILPLMAKISEQEARAKYGRSFAERHKAKKILDALKQEVSPLRRERTKLQKLEQEQEAA
jgi:hypothetical protein